MQAHAGTRRHMRESNCHIWQPVRLKILASQFFRTLKTTALGCVNLAYLSIRVLPCPVIHRVKVWDWFWRWQQSGERRSGWYSPQQSRILVSIHELKEEISPCFKAWLRLTPHPMLTSDSVYLSNITGCWVCLANLQQQWWYQLPMMSSMYKR